MSNTTQEVVVITGGNSGIGLAAAQAFVKSGAKVVITGRNSAAVHEAAKNLGGGAVGLVADQANLADLDRLVANVKQQFGVVNTLFINAGVASFAPVEAFSEQQFDAIMDINFKGAFFTLQKFLPLLASGSSVTLLSSVNAYTGMPTTSVYGASKAALNSLMRAAAIELAPRGIRVNAVCPGPIETPIFGKVGLPAEAVQEFGKAMQERVPLKRFGKADEVADLVLFLASAKAAFITGGEYVIDGGININPGLLN
jgi:NAD(P)-dependent dehydrogenase (short-subunit alcohol dehydrogenase family)